MRTVDDLQTLLRLVGRDSQELIESGSGLSLLNATYRRMAMNFPWPELRVQDTSITTTALLATYQWPQVLQYIQIRSLEMQDGEDANNYKLIPPASTELDWINAQTLTQASVPQVYMRNRNGTQDQIEFRRAPRDGSKTVRITGIKEPAALQNSGSRTVFILDAADDALVYMLSAEFLDIDGDPAFAAAQRGKAVELLNAIFDVQKRVSV